MQILMCTWKFSTKRVTRSSEREVEEKKDQSFDHDEVEKKKKKIEELCGFFVN